MQQTRRDGAGLATNPREWHSGASGAAPTRPCLYPDRAGREPRAKPGADPARARWEQQRGKAEGAELSPGTPPELGRHSRKRKEIRCSLVSAHGFFGIHSNPSPAPLPSVGGPGEPRVTVELCWGHSAGGRGSRAGHTEGSRVLLRPCGTQQPRGLPSAPSQIRIWVRRRTKMIQTQGMDPAVAHGVSCCPEHDPALLQPNRAEALAQLPSQSSFCSTPALPGGTSANQIQTFSGGTIIH